MESGVVGQSIARPPSTHLNAPLPEILDILRGRVPSGDREKFQMLARLAEASTEFDFLELRRRIKWTFRLFSDGAMGREYIGRLGRSLPSKTDLIQRELRFIADFLTLMQTAHYHLLSKELWDIALREDFELTMPLKVNLDVMDSKMLTRFWAERPSQREAMPHVANRVLIFYRGVSVSKKTDAFMSEKFDLLATYLVTDPLTYIWNKLNGKLSETKREKREGTREDAEKGVKRVSLRSLLPDWKSVVRQFFAKIEISEPTFDSVVVLYRKAKASLLPSTPNTKDNYHQAKRNIVIKMFDSVPCADLEVIFPEKVVNIRKTSWIYILITLVVAVISAAITITQTDIEMAVIGSALMLFFGKAFQSYTSMQREKAAMSAKISKMLYDKTRDSQDGALFALLDDMADQHMKRLCVAYSLLLLNSQKTAEIDELDYLCELFFKENFGKEVDFCLREKVSHLISAGLVTEDPENKEQLIAVELDTAIVHRSRRPRMPKLTILLLGHVQREMDK